MPEHKFNLRVRPDLETRKLSVQVELLTPQFGGGAEARTPDVKQWLRPASVRGALRFWWRALFGASFPNIHALHAAESAIFGSSAGDNANGQPGKLSVVVKALADGRATSWAEYQRREDERIKAEKAARRAFISSAQSIAYFPANENKTERLAAAELVSPSVRAELTVCALSAVGAQPYQLTDTQWQQVLEALRAFILFGGSGSRTRRSAGAICCASPHDAQALGMPVTADALTAWISKYRQQKYEHDCFLLSRCQAVYMTAEQYDKGERAQEALLRMWREFRQQRKHPESWSGPHNWGRTRWPEADAIRLIAGQYASWENGGHPIDHRPVQSNGGKASRAHLGLPIIVKYKDDATAREKETRFNEFRRGRWIDHEPQPTEIVQVKLDDTQKPLLLDRYASPILLAVTGVTSPRQQERFQFIGVVLITSSVLNQGSTLILKGQAESKLSPGAWEKILDSPTDPIGLYQVLARHNYRRLFPSEGTTK